MARWRASEAHYIFAKQADEEEPVEWEYKETDRITGRERRRRFKVPLYIEAEKTLCYEGSAQDSTDIIFEGPPTPAMTPIDDEAKAISAKHQQDWVHPIDSLPGQGFSSDKLLDYLQKQVEIASSQTKPSIAIAEGVSKEEFEELKAQLAMLMAQNAELQAKKPESPIGRRKAG